MFKVLRLVVAIFAAFLLCAGCSPGEREEEAPEQAARQRGALVEKPAEVAEAPSLEEAPLSTDISPEVYRIVDENDYLRVVLAVWKPGQADLPHYHPPFAAYSITAIEGMLHYPDNTEWPVRIPAGKTMAQRGNEVHAFESLASEETSLLMVERKIEQPVEERPEAAPLSHEVSPEVYNVVAENDYVRVIIATWQPGQRDIQHSHPPFAAYMLTDIEGMLHYPDESTWPVRIAKGRTFAQRGDDSHAFENISDHECKMLIVEAK